MRGVNILPPPGTQLLLHTGSPLHISTAELTRFFIDHVPREPVNVFRTETLPNSFYAPNAYPIA